MNSITIKKETKSIKKKPIKKKPIKKKAIKKIAVKKANKTTTTQSKGSQNTNQQNQNVNQKIIVHTTAPKRTYTRKAKTPATTTATPIAYPSVRQSSQQYDFNKIFDAIKEQDKKFEVERQKLQKQEIQAEKKVLAEQMGLPEPEKLNPSGGGSVADSEEEPKRVVNPIEEIKKDIQAMNMSQLKKYAKDHHMKGHTDLKRKDQVEEMRQFVLNRIY
jgi:hypothetical protein